jgi:hypothetical protein
MQMIMFLGVATLCLYLLRSAWRMLVEIPDARQAWVPDAVDDFLTRWMSATLVLDCLLFLVLLANTSGLTGAIEMIAK